MMKKLLVAAAVLGLNAGTAQAVTVASVALAGPFGIALTPSTADIESTTTAQTINSTYTVGTVTVGNAAHGVLGGAAVTLSPASSGRLTLPITNGPASFSLSVGTLTLGFTSVQQISLTPVSSYSVRYIGSVTADTLGTWTNFSAFLNQTGTQSGAGAAINGTGSLLIDTVPVPEPSSAALFGLGIAGLASARRWKKAAPRTR